MSGEEYDSDMDYSEEDCGYADYYNTEEDCDIDQIDPSKTDPEYFVFDCLSVEEVERLLNESVESLSNSLQVLVVWLRSVKSLPLRILSLIHSVDQLCVTNTSSLPSEITCVRILIFVSVLGQTVKLWCGQRNLKQNVSYAIFRCGTDYHAPTDCSTIKKWLTKCADDSETANYISAHTKDCPRCHICIEKNGGCNHMQCYNCKHDFCWMCLGDWKSHGSEYYECSRYKENPNIAHESVHAQAREALKKYLHYYERWENHSKSLKLEEQTLLKIKTRINKKVMDSSGTWIDWQYLLDATSLLAKCRYTLQYTYPYAYYMEAGPRKELFEYQQAQLEAEIENLSWKIERAETTDRGDLENQMDIAEKRRATLLKDFLEILLKLVLLL
ncbi:RBR-type E3 ubiquitin transferase, partial [Gryllus bimaculatus]